MNAVLVRKEWREARTVLIAGWGLAASLPLLLIVGGTLLARDPSADSVAGAAAPLLVLVVWPLLVVAAGAPSLSRERGDGTLEFLLTRPVSRGRVWITKVATGAVVALLLVAGAWAVSSGFAALAGTDVGWAEIDGMFDWPPTSRIGPRGQDAASVVTAISLVLLLFFAASVFASTFVARAMSAAACGLALGIGLLLGAFLLGTRLDVGVTSARWWLATEIVSTATVLLGASFVGFCRASAIRTETPRGAVSVLLAAAGAIVLLTLLASLIAVAPPAPATGPVALAGPTLAPGGGWVVGTSLHEVEAGHRSSPTLWLLPTRRDARPRQIGGRWAGVGALSPDGKNVAYVTAAGPVGLRAGNLSLRVTDVDGTDDRHVAGLPLSARFWTHDPFDTVSYGPAGDRVLVQVGNDRILVVEVGTGALVDQGLRIRRGHYEAWLVGWSEEGGEVLWLAGPRRRDLQGDELGSLMALDVDAGAVRTVRDLDALFWRPSYLPFLRVFQWPVSLSLADGRVPLVLFDTEDPHATTLRLELVDPGDGSSDVVTERSCRSLPAASVPGAWFAYAECEPRSRGDRRTLPSSRSRILLRPIGGGADRPLTVIAGEVEEMTVSRDGKRLLVRRSLPPHVSGSSAGERYLIIDATDGATRPLTWSGWHPVGWSDEDLVVLVKGWSWNARPHAGASIALGDPATDRLHVLHDATKVERRLSEAAGPGG